MPRGDGYGGRRAQRWVAGVLDRYGTTCHLCHHPGATSADHVVPRSQLVRRGLLHLMYDIDNGRPAHHAPCPVCGVRCQLRRKDKPLTAAPPLDRLTFFDTPR
jgi:hypothetical protein